MESITSNALVGKARRIVEGGVTYLVAHLTSIVPGVLPGSKGPLYYPPEEVKASVSDWDMVPLTVYHPKSNDGSHVSASSPGILERQGIGHIRNSRFDGKLRHEGWFDEAATMRVDPRVHDALVNGRRMEVSTGLYTSNVSKPGVHEGRNYDATAVNYRPDHMAILPDQRGACSNDDGCGLNVNQEVVVGKEDVELDLNSNPAGHNQYTVKKQPAGNLETEVYHVMAGDKHVGTISAFKAQAPAKPGQRLSSGKMVTRYSALVHTPNPTGEYERTEHFNHKSSAVEHITGRHERYMKPPVGNQEDVDLAVNCNCGKGDVHLIVLNRDWPQEKRDKTSESDFAGPDRSFPIQTQADVDAASHLIGQVKDPEAVKSRIKAIAKRRGLTVPQSWTTNMDREDVELEVNCGGKGSGKPGKCPTGGAGQASVRLPNAGVVGGKQHAQSHSEAAHAATIKAGGNHATRMHSSNASDMAGAGHNATDHHNRAAAGHREQAAAATKSGDHASASLHQAAATAHSQAAGVHEAKAAASKPAPKKKGFFSRLLGNQLTTDPQPKETKMKRSELLGILTANCKNDEDKAALNELSNTALVAIANGIGDMVKKNANRMAGKKDEELEDNDGTAGKAEGSNADATPNGSIQAGGAGKPTEYNTNAAVKPKTLSEFEQSMQGSPEAMAIWNTAKNAELRERTAVIDHLTANVANPERKAALKAKFMTMTVNDLNDLVPLAAPAPRRQMTLPDPIYVGAAAPAGITGNAVQDGDALDLPRMSYEDAA